MSRKNRDRKKKLMKQVRKLPNWVRHVAATKAYDPAEMREYHNKQLGTFGAASPVRTIMKDGQVVK